MPVEELWVPITDFPNYEISNFGRVVNVVTGKERKSSLRADGFLKIGLYREGVCTSFVLHRLVAREFFVMYSDDVEVTCLNGDYTECTVKNISIVRCKNGRRGGRKEIT